MTGRNTQRGFTLIELLVVIAIISLLSSVVLASLQGARASARDNRRLQDLRQMERAVQMYHNDNDSYPDTGGSWRGGASGCYGGHGYGSNGFIPGVAPDYINELPADPNPDPSSGNCYLYRSNGQEYMILAHGTVESFDPDPEPDGIGHDMDRPAYNQQSISVYSSGAKNW